MNTVSNIRVTTLALLGLALGMACAGCGAHNDTVQAPAGMKVGPPLSAVQIQALEQKKQARGKQPTQGQ